ncbi:MAG: J domain-containing protein [Candidatus Adiutrix sp.]
MPESPFEIFGLSPEMVARLSEKELFALLKSMYRALQKTVHPDVSKATKKGLPHKAVDLNLAFEALNLDKNPLSFRRHRKAFVARRPQSMLRKTQSLERALEEQKNQKQSLTDSYFDRLLLDYGFSRPHESHLPLAFFPLKNLRLGLLDVAINQNLRQVSWTIGSNYKEMKFDSDFGLSVRPIGRSRFSRASYIHLLGSMLASEMELLPLLARHKDNFFKAPALNASIGAHGPALSVLNRLTFDNFKTHVLPHLKGEVRERAYLFSLNRPDFAEGFVTLEGLVVKIEKNE